MSSIEKHKDTFLTPEKFDKLTIQRDNPVVFPNDRIRKITRDVRRLAGKNVLGALMENDVHYARHHYISRKDLKQFACNLFREALNGDKKAKALFTKSTEYLTIDHLFNFQEKLINNPRGFRFGPKLNDDKGSYFDESYYINNDIKRRMDPQSLQNHEFYYALKNLDYNKITSYLDKMYRPLSKQEIRSLAFRPYREFVYDRSRWYHIPRSPSFSDVSQLTRPTEIKPTTKPHQNASRGNYSDATANRRQIGVKPTNVRKSTLSK